MSNMIIKEKVLLLNGEVVGRGPNLYTAIMDARKNGHSISTVPVSELANGKRESQDRNGSWRFE